MRKMFLEILLIAVVIIVLTCLFFIFARPALSPISHQWLSGSVCIKERCFSVELAKTNAERERGLMFRTQLDKDKGMLFIFSAEGIYPFWMKNTLIYLDIIWINGNNKVVFISENAQPCQNLICPQIVPNTKAMYVLELNAGQAKKINLKIGDYALIKN